MERPPKRPVYQVVEGVTIPDRFSVETFRAALRYEPQDDDVFVVTYPKCGTTWTQQIALMIFSHGKPLGDPTEFWYKSPYIDVYGPTSVQLMPRPGAIKTHLPFDKIPYSPKAKYIFVARNPWDCCVSFYYHAKRVATNFEDGTFDEFFEAFMDGKVEYGDYFDHLSSWYAHRNDPNVFFTTYENLKKDTQGVIIKLADFLGQEYARTIQNNPEVLENILKYTSFGYMEENINSGIATLRDGSSSVLMKDPLLPDGLKHILSQRKPPKKPRSNTPPKFIRKGLVGDWKNYFSETQNERLGEKFLAKMQGTGIVDLWKDLNLPFSTEEQLQK